MDFGKPGRPWRQARDGCSAPADSEIEEGIFLQSVVRSEEQQKSIRTYYRTLYEAGPQNWWPAGSHFEVIVDAYLTQNTAWINVEKARAQEKVLERNHSVCVTDALYRNAFLR